MITQNSGVRQVQGSVNTLFDLIVNKMKIQKNGFLYIYTSNESAVPVYFDNLIINHYIGPLVEENQFYPSGIKMAAISSRAFTDSVTPINKMLFTGKELENSEFSDGWNLDWYDMGARMYDPQIGRFLTHDPNADQYSGMTPYNYAFNNPVSFNDPTGKDGKMTGAGTEDDPYIISANYYYYDLDEQQEGTFKTALAAYNNNGQATKVKINGKEVYVKFNLKGVKTGSLAEADQKTKADKFIGTDGKEHRFGNTVTAFNEISDEYSNMGGLLADGEDADDALATGESRLINFQPANLKNYIKDKGPINVERLMTGVWMHEIGHNLTLMHGDRGVMGAPQVEKTVGNPNGNADSFKYEYTDKLIKSNIESLLLRINLPVGALPEQDPGGEGTSGRIFQEK
jgi:RHS repeat-associated protein